MATEHREVVIVGAGAAGLAAARELGAHGRDVLVLERAERIGGRIFTSRSAGDDLPVELGAEFVHGDAPVTRALLDELGLRHVEGEGGAAVATGGRICRAPGYFLQVGRVLAQIDRDDVDRSFAEFVGRARATPAARAAAFRFVEGFHAADAGRISARSVAAPAGDVAQVSRSARVLAGQHALIRGLAALADVELRRGFTVRRVAWRRGRCEIQANDRAGEPCRVLARAVIITVSIGVLQQRELELTPEPPGYARALGQLAMGDVVRIPFIFDSRFWEDPGLADGALAATGFIHTPGSPFHVWWTQYPVLAPVLVAWSGGPAARALLDLPAEDRAARALHDLAGALALQPRALERRLVQWQTHDWHDDPAAHGAYSYALVAGADAAKRLARVHEGTLALAGEAIAEESGTVEGALASGRRATRALLRQWRS